MPYFSGASSIKVALPLPEFDGWFLGQLVVAILVLLSVWFPTLTSSKKDANNSNKRSDQLCNEEDQMRKELSQAHAITREFGMDELVWNHISVLLSDKTFLITPGDRMYDDIGPNDLIKSSGNVTADIIHSAIYKSRDDVKAIVHLHTPATVAVSCLEMGFVPLAQEAAPLVGRVARYPWAVASNDWEEQPLIAEAIKDRKYNTLLMENHGFCTFGKTLGEAWVLAYYFDRSCQTQLNVLQTGAKIKHPDPKVLAHAAEQALLPGFLPGANEWEALRKMLTRRGIK